MFSLKDKKVVLNTNVLLIPELKAVVDKYPDNYINVLSFVNFMTNPNKDENPFLEFREEDKVERLKKTFPGDYTEKTPVVKAAIARMVEDFIDLPEDRLYTSAKMAAEQVEKFLSTLVVNTISDTKVVMDVLLKMDKVTESLGKTRAARNLARSSSSVRGGKPLGYEFR